MLTEWQVTRETVIGQAEVQMNQVLATQVKDSRDRWRETGHALHE